MSFQKLSWTLLVPLLQIVQVLALITPRNDTNSTNTTVDSGGMSRVVETSIIVVLILAILFLVALHIFRKWSFFGQHVKWMFCRYSSSTSATHGDRHDRVDTPMAQLDRIVTGDSSYTHTSSTAHLTVKAELQRPPKAQSRMATRHDVSTVRNGRRQ